MKLIQTEKRRAHDCRAPRTINANHHEATETASEPEGGMDVVIRETQVLRRWSDAQANGRGGCGEAFGCGIDYNAWLADIPNAKSYHFAITLSEKWLELEIDAYSAANRPFDTPESFDDEAWEAQKVHLQGIPTRRGFRMLSSIARALLSGRDVALSGGVRLPGILTAKGVA